MNQPNHLPSVERYSKSDYKNKLRKQEKELIGMALKKTGNNLFFAWLLNCPVNEKRVPFYSIEAYYRVAVRHGFSGFKFVSNYNAKQLKKEINGNSKQKETV